MSDYDDAVDAMTKAVVKTRYDVYKPPEVYADELLQSLLELGYMVKLWRTEAALRDCPDRECLAEEGCGDCLRTCREHDHSPRGLTTT